MWSPALTDNLPSASLSHVLRVWLSLSPKSQKRFITFWFGKKRLHLVRVKTLSGGIKDDPGSV